jgi:hypothetical protein
MNWGNKKNDNTGRKKQKSDSQIVGFISYKSIIFRFKIIDYY